MLSTMRRGFAFEDWLTSIRMPQDTGARVSAGQRVCPEWQCDHRGADPGSRGGDPLPGGVEICTTLSDSLNPP